MKKRFGLALFSSLALLACTEKAPTIDPVAAETVILQEPAPDFADKMQQIARDYFALRPETATYYGVPDEKAGAGISSRLARYSVEGEIERRAGLKAILDELAAIDKTQLTESQRISLEPTPTVTQRGFGKRTRAVGYPRHHRGGQGVRGLNITDKNGPILSLLQLGADDEIMLVTDRGKILRMAAKDIPVVGRVTQGVKLMDAEADEQVVSVAKVAEKGDDTEPSAGLS